MDYQKGKEIQTYSLTLQQRADLTIREAGFVYRFCDNIAKAFELAESALERYMPKSLLKTHAVTLALVGAASFVPVVVSSSLEIVSGSAAVVSDGLKYAVEAAALRNSIPAVASSGARFLSIDSMVRSAGQTGITGVALMESYSAYDFFSKGLLASRSGDVVAASNYFNTAIAEALSNCDFVTAEYAAAALGDYSAANNFAKSYQGSRFVPKTAGQYIELLNEELFEAQKM